MPTREDTVPSTARVTLVIPCHNRSHLLGECLASVLGQTEDARVSWQVVVVDDGSGDPTEAEEVVRELEDGRVQLMVHGERRGPAAALNTGISAARTEFVLPLDAGDRLEPGALNALLSAVDADPALDCTFGSLVLFGRAHDQVAFPGPPAGAPLLHLEHSLPGFGALIRRSLWEELGGFDEARVLWDGRWGFEFWIRASARGFHWSRLEAGLYARRVLHATMDVQVGDDRVAEHILGKHGALYAAAGARKAFLAVSAGRAARAAYMRGERWRAFQLAMRGWRCVPTRSSFLGGVRALLTYSQNAKLDAGIVRRAIPFVGYPLRSQTAHRPFFVIGMGRSGNTLLRRILTSHSKLHLPPETFVIGRCIQKFKREGRRLTWPDLVYAVLAEFEFHPEFHLFEMDLAPLAQRLACAPRRDRNLAFLLDAVFRHHAQTHGIEFERWGDKTPMNSLDDALVRGDEPRRIGAGVPETLERLLQVFPDAQFLHIYRDGCDVVNSSLRGGFFDDLELAAKRWLHVESQTRRFARQHPERSIDIRYEELVARPEEVVRGLCTFLGIEFESSMLSSESASANLGDVPAWFWHAQVAQPITAANAGKARRRFNREERERLQALIGPALQEFGYPAATAEPEAS